MNPFHFLKKHQNRCTLLYSLCRPVTNPPWYLFCHLSAVSSAHGPNNYKDTEPWMSSLLVFNRVYRLEILGIRAFLLKLSFLSVSMSWLFYGTCSCFMIPDMYFLITVYTQPCSIILCWLLWRLERAGAEPSERAAQRSLRLGVGDTHQPRLCRPRHHTRRTYQGGNSVFYSVYACYTVKKG